MENQVNEQAAEQDVGAQSPGNQVQELTTVQQKLLTDQQKQALILFATGMNGKQVAKELGVHFNTVYNWKELPAFQAELKRIAPLSNSAFAPIPYGPEDLKNFVVRRLIEIASGRPAKANEIAALRELKSLLSEVKAVTEDYDSPGADHRGVIQEYLKHLAGQGAAG